MPYGLVEFLRAAGLAVVLLAWLLSGMAARIVAARSGNARRKGLYLGLGACNGLGLVFLVALALR